MRLPARPPTARVRIGSYSALLAALLLVTLSAPILGDAGVEAPTVLRLLWTVALLAGASVAVGRPRSLASLLALAVLIQVTTWLLPSGWEATRWIALAAEGLFLGWVLRLVLGDVVRGGDVTADRILGAVAAFLLLGLLWARLHLIVATLSPGAYAGVAGEVADADALATYFSFVTLTTLGYGDLAPVSATARTLAWLEALSGQLYVAIVIARLVGLHIVRTDDGAGAASRG